MKKVLFIFGTRPEAIKFAPLIKEMQRDKKSFNVRICVTGQHKEMLNQVLDFFEINPDYNLHIMGPNQTLFDITAKIIKKIEPILKQEKPDLVFVQGDTTTTLMGALGAFYEKIPVAHLEAGLRTGDIYSPFPEELNRVIVSKLSSYHFAPTKNAVANLLEENNDKSKIYMVGNTVIDSLLLGVKIVRSNSQKYFHVFSEVDFTKKVILITSHRRESIGAGFRNICEAVKRIAINNNVEIVFPIHYSPAVREAAIDANLSSIKNIHIMEPLDYPSLVYIMDKSYIVLTDSGGIQEEAPSLGKPVLVMRETTERPEGVGAGVAKLVGVDQEEIVYQTEELIRDINKYQIMANIRNPYGDGTASRKITDILKQQAA